MDLKKVVSIKTFCKKYPDFLSEASIRWMIQKRTIDSAIVRISNRIYILEDEFKRLVASRRRIST